MLVGDAGAVTLGSGGLMIFGATLLWSVEVVVVKRLLASLAGTHARRGSPRDRARRACSASSRSPGRWSELSGFGAEQWGWVLLADVI